MGNWKIGIEIEITGLHGTYSTEGEWTIRIKKITIIQRIDDHTHAR